MTGEIWRDQFHTDCEQLSKNIWVNQRNQPAGLPYREPLKKIVWEILEKKQIILYKCDIYFI